jgi:hypothetical protein
MKNLVSGLPRGLSALDRILYKSWFWTKNEPICMKISWSWNSNTRNIVAIVRNSSWEISYTDEDICFATSGAKIAKKLFSNYFENFRKYLHFPDFGFWKFAKIFENFWLFRFFRFLKNLQIFEIWKMKIFSENFQNFWKYFLIFFFGKSFEIWFFIT